MVMMMRIPSSSTPNCFAKLQQIPRRTFRVFSSQAKLETQKAELRVGGLTSISSTPNLNLSYTAQVKTLPNNITVASTGIVSPAVGISWKFPAGSRFEGPLSSGLSHYLRHALFMGNSRESSLALARNSELRGANLLITNDRESITITTDCPYEEATNMIGSISHILEGFNIQQYQLAKVEEGVALDRDLANADLDTILWNQAFEAAFHNELGNSPISYGIKSSNNLANDINEFFQMALRRSGHVIAATGLDNIELVEAVKTKFSQNVAKLAPPPKSPIKYYGGERRIENSGDYNYILIAFGTGGRVNPAEDCTGRILAALIGAEQSVQYGTESTNLTGLKKLLATNQSLKIHSEIIQYSDGGLLGIKVSIPSSSSSSSNFDLKAILQSICRELKDISSGSISGQVLALAKTRAIFQLFSSTEGRTEQASTLAENVLLVNGDTPHDVSFKVAGIQNITTADFTSQSSKILTRKPVIISLGNLRVLPYADELGF